MKKELEDKLINNYPILYQQHMLDKSQTCMCWGFECNDGWYDLIDELSHNLEIFNKLQNKNSDLIISDLIVKATQVKEKFGTLRFYYDGGNDITDNIISVAEEKSATICSNCGSNNDVQSTSGWVNYLCKRCMAAKKIKDHC